MQTHRDSGFTLVELLVAFSILLLGMTGIISLFAAGLALERQSSLELDTAAVLAEIAPRIKRDLQAMVDRGETVHIKIPRSPVEGRIGLEYEVEAEDMPGEDGAYLVKITVYPVGGDEADGISYGYLPLKLAPSYEELVRRSRKTLPPLK